MTDIVKIKIKLKSGKVKIRAASESLVTIFDRLETLLPALIAAKMQFSNSEGEGGNEDDDEDGNEDEDEDEGDDTDEVSDQNTNEKTSSGVPAENKGKVRAEPKRSLSRKPETFETVELGLNSDERQAFKDYYADKSPSGPSNHVLTVIYWLIKNTDKVSLSTNEVFTGLRTVNEKAPKRLTYVLSGLALSSYIIKNGAHSALHHIGEDYIERELPKKKIQ